MSPVLRTCVRCGRTRYESKPTTRRYYGTEKWACTDRDECRDAWRAVREKVREEHKLQTVGPGIPACSCGEVFEWKYEHEDHVNRIQRSELSR